MTKIPNGHQVSRAANRPVFIPVNERRQKPAMPKPAPRLIPPPPAHLFRPRPGPHVSMPLPTLPEATEELKFPPSMFHVFMWKWTQPGFREDYTMRHVAACADMLRKHLDGIPYKLHLLTDERYGAPDGVEVHDLWSDHETVANASGWHLPSCYRRLKLFDAATLDGLGIRRGERVISLDLDAVVVAPLKNILYRRERFVGWGVPGTYHPRVFNGSFWMFTAGDLQHLWHDFNPMESPKRALKTGFLGSDQGWLSLNLSRSGDAHGVRFPDIASYPREVRRQRSLHPGTKIVFFHGAKKPWHVDVQRESSWVTRYWPG